jgi:hypothetical protein
MGVGEGVYVGEGVEGMVVPGRTEGLEVGTGEVVWLYEQPISIIVRNTPSMIRAVFIRLLYCLIKGVSMPV